MKELAGFLADTWWFGLSRRLSGADFQTLAARRVAQGFSAVQLVVGVPPEVGPANPNAASEAGFPWLPDGRPNPAYLAFARERIHFLNALGLLVIIYGAWGHQVDWLGKERMLTWWKKLVETLANREVVFCLCGESGLWVGESDRLLPDKTTANGAGRSPSPIVARVARRVHLPTWLSDRRPAARRLLKRRLYARRRAEWSWILDQLVGLTDKPFIIHPTADETGYQAVNNPHQLATNTYHTGHSARSRARLWQLPLGLQRQDSLQRGSINLEPWYEGILDQFWTQDQVYAYWASMLAGTISFCYGAHGIWNVGDGHFLAHWGRQTFAQALARETPGLLGLSHREYCRRAGGPGRTIVHRDGRDLVRLVRHTTTGEVHFVPDSARVAPGPAGAIWLPGEGSYSDSWPATGPVVIFADAGDQTHRPANNDRRASTHHDHR